MKQVKIHVSNELLEKHFGVRSGDVLEVRYEFKGEMREAYLCVTPSGKNITIYKSECTPHVDN